MGRRGVSSERRRSSCSSFSWCLTRRGIPLWRLICFPTNQYDHHQWNILSKVQLSENYKICCGSQRIPCKLLSCLSFTQKYGLAIERVPCFLYKSLCIDSCTALTAYGNIMASDVTLFAAVTDAYRVVYMMYNIKCVYITLSPFCFWVQHKHA